MTHRTRREFLRDLGLTAAALPFVGNLPSIAFANQERRKKRLVIMFSPNGVVQNAFWPDAAGNLSGVTLKESLSPLEPFKNQMLTLHGVCDRVRGDGDAHMRGMGCLLTGVELFPGNVQGGSDTPAGWASGISIDQEIKNFLQRDQATAHALRLAGIRHHGAQPGRHLDAHGLRRRQPADRARSTIRIRCSTGFTAGCAIRKPSAAFSTTSVPTCSGCRRCFGRGPPAARRAHDVRARDGAGPRPIDRESRARGAAVLEPNVRNENNNIPRIRAMQIDLMVNSFATDFARVATLQFTNSVGRARMNWLGISEGHHELSHKPDSDRQPQEQLTKINKWYLRATRVPGPQAGRNAGTGRQRHSARQHADRLDQRTGQGQLAHARQHPVRAGRQRPRFPHGPIAALNRVPHNRLLLSLAHGMGHRIERFGNPNFCGDGVLGDST